MTNEQPRPQGFSLKKPGGEKPWGRGWTNEPTIKKSIQPHFRRKCDILNISLSHKMMSVIFPLMQRLTVISNEHDDSLDQCTFSMDMLLNLKTSNGISLRADTLNVGRPSLHLFFVMKEKQHISQQPKGQKASLVSMTTTCMFLFQSWVKQLIIGKEGKKETKHFVSVPGMKYTPFLHINEVRCLASNSQWKK